MQSSVLNEALIFQLRINRVRHSFDGMREEIKNGGGMRDDKTFKGGIRNENTSMGAGFAYFPRRDAG